MQLAAIAQSGGPGLVKSYLFLWGPFILWTGVTCWKCLTSVATLAHMEGRGGPPCLPKAWPWEGVKILATTCSSVRNVLFALEQDMPSEAFFIAR